MLPVVTVFHVLGPRIEDIGTATFLDHALLEAGANTHLLRVFGRVKVRDRDIAAITGAVTIVAPKSVQGFL